MSRAVVGTFTVTAAAVLSGKLKAEAICLEPDGVCDAVVSGVAITAAALKQLLPAQDMAPDNLTEGLSELPDSVGIDEGVDHRVGMREDNGHIHDPGRRTSTLRTEEGEAVDDVQWQPADCKQSDDDGQRLGCLDLFLQCGARLLPMNRFHLDQLELATSCHEDTQVDGQHQQQRNQYAGKKVEVDHILHDHHLLKQALHQARRAGAVAGLGHIVPAHHWSQTDDDG